MKYFTLYYAFNKCFQFLFYFDKKKQLSRTSVLLIINAFNSRCEIKRAKCTLKFTFFYDIILSRIKLGSRALLRAEYVKNIAIHIHQLASRFNCPSSPTPRSLPDEADNFHVNSNVNKNTDVSFNTLPKRTLCRPRGRQRDYLCVSASGGLFQVLA